MDDKATPDPKVAEAVQDWAEFFALLEDHIDADQTAVRSLGPQMAVIRDAGYIGGIECDAICAEADALLTSHKAAVLSFHAQLTERAKELGIDLPPRQRSGGR